MKALFRRVNATYRPSRGEKLLFFNAKTEQVSASQDDFNTTWTKIGLGRPSVDIYLADLKSESVGATQQFWLKDFHSDERIELKIEYLVRVDDHNLEEAFNSFRQFGTLENILNEYVLSLVKQYASNQALISRTSRHLTNLQKYVARELKDYLPGYDIAIRVKLVEKINKRQRITSENLRLRFMDSEGEIKVHFTAEVKVDEQLTDLARQSEFSDGDVLRSRLQEEIKEYFLTQVAKVKFFLPEFRKKELVSALIPYLNVELRKHGREITFFEFNEKLLREQSAPESIIALPVGVLCKVRHASSFIDLEVSTKVSMELLAEGEGKAVLAGIVSSGSLKSWAVKNIKEIVETTFLEQKDFADVVISFFDGDNIIERTIGDELRHRAERIGYFLKYYNVLPDLKEFEKRQKKVSVTGVSFKTKGGDIPISLSYEIEGRIKSWESIKEYLSPDKDLERSLEDQVTAVIKEVVLSNNAERLYMHFYDEYEGKQSVEQELQQQITEALAEFNLEDLKIRLLPAESEIKTRFNQVLNKINRVTTVFRPLKGIREKITYHFSYRITGIDRENAGFNTFYSSKDLEIDHWLQEINRHLEGSLINFLNTKPALLVKYTEDGVREKLEQVFRDGSAIPAVKTTFGLEIAIDEFRRDLTEGEKEEGKTATVFVEEKEKFNRSKIKQEFADRLTSGKGELKRIEAQLQDLYLQGQFKTAEDEAEIKRLETQKQELQDSRTSTIDAMEAQYEPESHSPDEIMALLSGLDKPLLGDGKKSEEEEKDSED